MNGNSSEPKIGVLVVEDNPPDVELLRWALRKAQFDCELTVVDDGRDAIEFVRQTGKYSGMALPDIVVLDLNLPKNDGLEILQALRANPAYDDVPVVVLSSSSSPRERARLEGYRVSSYITKPADLDEYATIGVTLRQMAERGGRSSPAAG